MNYKGFKFASINLFNPLTVLIGPNGSGKSNVIEGVELLAFLVHGQPIHEIHDIERSNTGAMEIRGGLQSCARHGEDGFSMGFLANFKFLGESRSFVYDIQLDVKPKPKIRSESLIFTDKDIMIFRTIPKKQRGVSSDIQVEYNNFAPGGHKPRTSVSGSISVISQYNDFAKKNKKYKECAKMVSGIKRWLQSSFVFDPNPKSMRNYERIGNDNLLRDGANLSAVLYGLSEGGENEKKSLERIVDKIKHLPEEPFISLDFVTTPLNDVIFGFKEKDGENIIDARLLSDGTLRCLAVLTALETVEDGSRVVIEEFDNGLHPSRVKILLEAIDSCCKRKKLNVLITTHNPATLNKLSNEQLKGVVFCIWNNETSSFELVEFNNLPRFDELVEKGRLGDLVSKQIIETHFRKDFEKEKKSKTLEWLNNLE